MSKINAIRLINLNYNNDSIRIADETFRMNGENTLLSLRNGGGKTVLVQMMTAPFVHKRYRDTKDRPFESYFQTNKPTFILVEWELDAKEGYVLTGMMVRKNQNVSELQNPERLEIIQFISYYRENCERDLYHFPVIDKKGKCIGTISRRNFLDMHRKKVVLVDHNEKDQAVDNIDKADIMEIIDHHKLGTLQTMQPISFRNQPVGCTGTIMYQMYGEQKLEIPPKIAGLLRAAIISDTLMFRSPTCTLQDKMAAGALALIADISIEEFAREMFKAGSNLKDKSPEEIFYQDYKKFIAEGDICFGVGQISSMDADELREIKERLIPFMVSECGRHGVSRVYFMLTDIMEQSTELLFYGEGSEEMAVNAFKIEPKDGTIYLKGVVSRKKQLIPPLMEAAQMIGSDYV